MRIASLMGSLILASLALVLLAGPPATALPLAQEATVVSPADITTPTPVGSPTAPLVITPTATLAANPVQQPPLPRTYTVRAGDTLLTVALEIGANVDEMPCVIAPDFTRSHPLVIGNQLEIPLPNVLCHQVLPGETLQSIATQYGVAPETIYTLPWNRLTGQPLANVQLTPEWHLRIPLLALPQPANVAQTPPADGPQSFLPFMLHQTINTSPFVAYAVGGPSTAPPHVAVPANWPYGSGHFTWPLHGWLTQEYRYDHRAIDVAAPLGTPVTAADRGVVIRAGWNNQGYGNFVVIDHRIDYVTLYAHLSEILVNEGDVVAQGQVIGKVGSTGNSTGPHLHFEIRDFGRLSNPLEFLGH